MKLRNNGIPVLYYHSIANHEVKNNWSFLSISIELFKKQVNYLLRKGYYACDWKELEDHIKGIKKLPRKTVMFHFDDGFLDNWSVVFPIMKKAGFKYSIVITPDFIQKTDRLRPFVSNTLLSNQEDWWGYLSESEIKHMADSGLVDFQAHGHTHTWYEVSDELIDICCDNAFYPHLKWNGNRDKKPYWLTQDLPVKTGYPVFKYKKSLEMDYRFFPNPSLINELIDTYDHTKDKNYNFKLYKDIISVYRMKGETGRYETNAEKSERLRKELQLTRSKLETIIGKPVEYIVFPGGGNSEEVISLCKEYGYKLTSKGTALNAFNSNTYQINRYSGVFTFPFMNTTLNMFFLKLQLMRGQGSPIVNSILKLINR